MTSGVLLLPLVTTPDPADAKPGWLAFVIFLAMFAAVILLWLSMRRQLKKIDFEEAPDDAAQSVRTRRTRQS